MPSHRGRRMLAAVYHMRTHVAFYATGNRLIPTSCLDA